MGVVLGHGRWSLGNKNTEAEQVWGRIRVQCWAERVGGAVMTSLGEVGRQIPDVGFAEMAEIGVSPIKVHLPHSVTRRPC